MLKGQRVAAVIQVSDYREDCSAGIESVVRLKEYFRELHIILPRKYEIPDSGRTSLAPLEVHTHYEEFAQGSLNKDTLLLVHIQPDQKVEEKALETLLESAHLHRQSCDHYAVRGKIDCEQQKRHYLLGFVWFIAYMDWFRTLFNWWGYHRTDDLRATKVVPSFPHHSVIATYQHAWIFAIFSRIASVEYINDTSLSSEPRDDLYVFRHILTHAHMGISNIPWILSYLVYYFLFSLPWWNLFLDAPQYTEASIRSSAYILLYWIAHRNPAGWIFTVLWCIQIIVMMIIISKRFKHVNLSWVFLMPLYVTLSPLVFLVGRIKKK